MSSGPGPLGEDALAGAEHALGPVGLQTLLDLLLLPLARHPPILVSSVRGRNSIHSVSTESDPPHCVIVIKHRPFSFERVQKPHGIGGPGLGTVSTLGAEPLVRQVKKTRIKRDDFHILKVIAEPLVRQVKKTRIKRDDFHILKTACYQEEREVLLKGDRRWITELHYAFQDDDYLYLVMDYYVGGDLLTLLSKFGDRIPEELAQFYLAEMILAIDSVHRLGYVHRDIKPDNILLTADGHIRLGDFGSCLRVLTDGMVSTADYLSPEILRAVDGGGGYGPECDWWALGICAYEMLLGTTPFYAESISETHSHNHIAMDYFEFPPLGPEVSDTARSFIAALVCEREERLGSGGLGDFRGHPFFCDLDWSSLHKLPAPYLPEVTDATDTSNFDVLDDCLSEMETLSDVMDRAPIGVHLAFVGYSYTATSQTGAVDRSRDIMMEIDHSRLRKYEQLYSAEKLVWQVRDSLPEDLSALLELPLAVDQSTETSSQHTTIEEEEEDEEEEEEEEEEGEEVEEEEEEEEEEAEDEGIKERISGLDEDLQRRLQEAERRYCELEKEMERLRGEMQDRRTNKTTGKASTDVSLYLVMDYYVGGDLLTLLSKFGDRIPEELAQFYLAEMILAIDSVHRLGYVHRDIKPDNILLTADGHIRLGDFGSCLRVLTDGMVSTADYLSPEILRAVDGGGGYGPECDWWALGICAYEMLLGTTPFYAESISETHSHNHIAMDYFEFPPLGPEVSDTARSFIAALVCEREERLGSGGLGDFRGHPFFCDLDWSSLPTSCPRP
ncbi:hypothetical protein CRUP_027033 [Coryphaenoides rupestris]|nr:hypothetical protein CRUP_027033 [Coryphaenoides rupestris]